MKAFFKKSIILLFLLFIYISISAYSYAMNVSSNIASGVFRLHVIANSDSDIDQNLKYIVRDSVLEYMKDIVPEDISSKEETVNIISDNLEEFKKVAQNSIYENGFDYPVSIEIGNFYFPTKYYGDVSLPCGYYDSLRIKIGDADGKNWWCVMYPTLCFVDVTSGIVPEESKETLDENLDDEEYDLITGENSEFEFKFKVVELFESLKEKLFG